MTPVYTCAAFLYIVWSVQSILFVFMFLYNCDTVVVLLLSTVWLFETHGLQHGRLHCPLLSLRVCSNSWLLSRWCHPTISSSAVPYSCPQTFPVSGPFPKSGLFTSGGQNIGASASASALPMNIQDWFPLGLNGLISLPIKKRTSRVLSNSQFKSIDSSALSLLYGPTLTSIQNYWKNHSFDYREHCHKSDISAL